MNERHLTRDEVADREGVSPRTVEEWDRRGTGPKRMKVGRHVRYRLADVLAWEKTRVITDKSA